jgi:hypothetical protein
VKFAIHSHVFTAAIFVIYFNLTTTHLLPAVEVVSNLGEGSLPGAPISNFSPMGAATSFTTGAGLWEINTISARLAKRSATNPDVLELQILNDNEGSPGSTVIGAMDMTTNLIGGGIYTYGPSAPLTLLGNKTYWLTGQVQSYATYGWNTTASTNDNGISGWSIGNSYYQSPSIGTWVFGSNEPLLFSINAIRVPEPSVLALLIPGFAVTRVSRFPRSRN